MQFYTKSLLFLICVSRGFSVTGVISQIIDRYEVLKLISDMKHLIGSGGVGRGWAWKWAGLNHTPSYLSYMICMKKTCDTFFVVGIL